jgi:hypothetical protein
MVVFREIHVLLQISWLVLCGTKWAFLHLVNYYFHEVFLLKLMQFLQGIHVLEALASNTNVCLWKVPVFLHLSWIVLVGKNRACLHLEIPKLQEVFFEILTQFSHGAILYVLQLLTQWLCLEGYMFLQLSWVGLFQTKWSFPQFENYDFCKDSFQI